MIETCNSFTNSCFNTNATGKLATEEELQKDQHSTDWITVPYKTNRGILHDGYYPHLSTPITHINPDLKRVILGFNCFPGDVSECCSRAPEHSAAFNRTIKLYQSMAALGVPITTAASLGDKYNSDNQNASQTNNNVVDEVSNDRDNSIPNASVSNDRDSSIPNASVKGIHVKEVLKNPALAKLLVMAAKKLKTDQLK